MLSEMAFGSADNTHLNLDYLDITKTSSNNLKKYCLVYNNTILAIHNLYFVHLHEQLGSSR